MDQKSVQKSIQPCIRVVKRVYFPQSTFRGRGGECKIVSPSISVHPSVAMRNGREFTDAIVFTIARIVSGKIHTWRQRELSVIGGSCGFAAAVPAEFESNCRATNTRVPFLKLYTFSSK